VSFEGGWRDVWRANLELRTAIRVLSRVGRFRARDADELYKGAMRVDWSQFLGPEATIAVRGHARDSELDHTLFIAQRVKDAVCDQARERTGERPSVDKSSPSLRIHAHIFRDRCTLSVDTSGDSLHRRGWREIQGRAPLSESLAAALLMASGWNQKQPLLDPFCGSGTFLVEGAWMAMERAPGLDRGFAFEAWPGHDAGGFSKLRETLKARVKPLGKRVIWGGDSDPKMVEAALHNVERAGLSENVQVEVADARSFTPRHGWNAQVLTNPPFGERVSDERRLVGVYERFGEALREHAQGFRVALLSGNPNLERCLGMPQAANFIDIKNGALGCRFLNWEL
jgi:23S rRNA (guanine2445-N2)-methyltransferase / 23S rRNA (guanine2069-N7)-methyltransferase